MSILNTPTIQSVVSDRLNSLSTTSTAIGILSTVLAANATFTNVASSVPDKTSLPDIYDSDIQNGHLVFVENIKLHVIASNREWLSLDGRVFRSDMPDSILMSWGSNFSGLLGDGTTVNKSSPVSVVGGFINWCQISAGTFHTAAVRTNGTLWAWGCSSRGQLGDGTIINRSSPVSVVGGFTDWCRVSSGANHTAAVRTTGTVWAWGCGSDGQLGDGTAVNRSSPVLVVGGFTDWCQVSAGSGHTVAIRTNGTLWSWGFGQCGRLGDDTIFSKSSPVSVVGGFTDWCQVSAGSVHTAAIRTDGTLWSWGRGLGGQIGDNTAVSKSSPVSVIGGFTDWCQVSGGSGLTAAVRLNGSLWAWGYGTNGRLGDGTVVDKSSPVSVLGGFTDWCQVGGAGPHLAAIRTNGTLWSWGCNGIGRLGDGTTTDRSSPVLVVGGFTDWCQVTAGYCHFTAIRSY